VEYNEAQSADADYFVEKYIRQMMTADPLIDAAILGCTHYPLLMDKIRRFMPPTVAIIPQGNYVAEALADYLQRHPEMAARCSRHGLTYYLTTENADKFNEQAQLFLNEPVAAEHIVLG
jgi:glutamate racemase